MEQDAHVCFAVSSRKPQTDRIEEAVVNRRKTRSENSGREKIR